MLKLALSGNAFINAYNEKSPNIICENAYQIAVAFSKFYHENHIMSESDGQKKASWLALCIYTKDMLQKHLDEGTGYSEEGLKLSHGRESFRANDFYISLGDWELDYTCQVNKARTPITQGDEIEIAKRLFRKYEKLSAAYYQTKVSNADIIKTEKTYENLGE